RTDLRPDGASAAQVNDDRRSLARRPDRRVADAAALPSEGPHRPRLARGTPGPPAFIGSTRASALLHLRALSPSSPSLFLLRSEFGVRRSAFQRYPPPLHIDLNCDMGESFGRWELGAGAEILPFVSSANIACGAHAGDPAVMRWTLRLAKQ